MKTKTQLFDPAVMSGWETSGWGGLSGRPETPMQALMEAAPSDEPDESGLEHELKVEGLRTAMDCALDDRERWVIESIFYRRRGIRLLAEELSLSKTHIARIRDRAFAAIATYMEENPTE